jgi:hypothetical protein
MVESTSFGFNFPNLCVFLKNFLLPSFSHENIVLNSNFDTKITYGACNQHVFRVGWNKNYWTIKTEAFESIYITQEDITIYLNFIQLI